MKGKLLLAVIAGVICNTATAASADSVMHSVNVSATVPTESFSVEPVGNWLNNEQVLSWNSITEELSGVKHQMVGKSTIGPIVARLTNEAMITSGVDQISLDVKIGGKSLGTSSVEVLAASEAVDANYMAFEISPVKPVSGYTPGKYSGVVNMIFETEAL